MARIISPVESNILYAHRCTLIGMHKSNVRGCRFSTHHKIPLQSDDFFFLSLSAQINCNLFCQLFSNTKFLLRIEKWLIQELYTFYSSIKSVCNDRTICTLKPCKIGSWLKKMGNRVGRKVRAAALS